MDLDATLRQLNATAEVSRLRLLAALLAGESPVGDLVAVLEQSQPRVSRHLRVLAEAGLLESFREGRSIFYRWTDPALAEGVAGMVAALQAGTDPTLAADRRRLAALRRRREPDALRRALKGGKARELRAVADTDTLTELLATAVGPAPVPAALEIGAGSGELLGWLLSRAGRVTGTETAADRRRLARARLQATGQAHWSLRNAAPEDLPFAASSFDLVLLTTSLGPAGSRSARLAEAIRVLTARGQLLVFDHVLPRDRVLPRTQEKPARLSDAALTAELGALGLVVTRRQWLPGRAPDLALFHAARREALADQQPVERTGTDG